MSFPWIAGTMLAFESNVVITLRLMKLAAGGEDAIEEAQLMVDEKIDAALEAMQSLWVGATPDMIIDRYRVHVAANTRRLSAH